MSNMFRVTLYTAQQLSDIKKLQALWHLLDNPLIDPQRYDSVERAKFPFRSDAVGSAAQLYQEQKFLFVRGRKDSFLGVFNEKSRGLSTWDFWIDVRAMQGKKAKRWLEWLFHLCNELPVLYGFGCSIEEYDAKHLYVERLQGGGTATGAVGVSVSEFYQYLPGLYWLTLFGAELVEAFGQSKLMTLPGVEAIALGSQQIAIRLVEPVLPANMEQRLRTEGEIADRLGVEFFFDRNRTNLKFESVPQLVNRLNQLPLDQTED